MCGIAGIFGGDWELSQLEAMVASQSHRGPDARGVYAKTRAGTGRVGLGHNRLSIIDLSPAGGQPMSNSAGRLRIVFNGEIYNYLELRAELSDYPYASQTDTEVVLAAYERWGEACLERFTGMFAFLIWDEREGRLFAARDRFGVKPLYYHVRPDGTLIAASEIKALHAAGVAARPDEIAWANYLTAGLQDASERTFWEGVKSLAPGHTLAWQDGRVSVRRWYDLAGRVGDEYDARAFDDVREEYLAHLTESVRLRFRSDVRVGINLSGGLDSSVLLGVVRAVRGSGSEVEAFTFVTGDSRYDELPWVSKMIASTRHPLSVCHLGPEDVPALAESVQDSQDEPFGGLPTLAYARLFETARARGVTVLLDGQGMDEQWAGYDYYFKAADENQAAPRIVQGSVGSPVRPGCLVPEFRKLAEEVEFARPFPDALRNAQYRDTRHTKIPRALRFNDRISMRVSTELREPFLDHRLVELALRQPAERKLRNGTGKWMLRKMAEGLLPEGIAEAPKRPVQTPQREWLRGRLRVWAAERIEQALAGYGGAWLDPKAVRSTWGDYVGGRGDNSFYVWQWISLGMTKRCADLAGAGAAR